MNNKTGMLGGAQNANQLAALLKVFGMARQRGT